MLSNTEAELKKALLIKKSMYKPPYIVFLLKKEPLPYQYVADTYTRKPSKFSKFNI